MALINRIAAAFALIVTLSLALSAPAWAQGISGAQQQALADRIESFNAAMTANDMTGIMEALPPKLLEKLASTYGVTVPQLLEAMEAQTKEALGQVKIVSFGMDLENADIVTLDTGITYAMIPTETVVDLGDAGGKMKASAQTLGILEGEIWYIVRVDDAQQATLVKELYPALADVEFPAGTVEAVTE